MSWTEHSENEETDELLEKKATLDAPKNWRLSSETLLAIQQGQDSDKRKEQTADSNKPNTSDSQTGASPHETGKILTDDREPGVSTHLHRHEDGVTISVKDQNAGTVERYNFNTGEGFEKSVGDMSAREAQRRMRSEHTDNNPNPDKDTIPGFHSSVWTKPPRDEDENKDHEE